MNRMFTRLLGMVDTVSNQSDTENSMDIWHSGDSASENQDIETMNESKPNPPEPTDELDVTEPAVSDLQAVAEQFNAAFNTALYELESARKLARERSARIDELNESVEAINNSLEEEISKRHQQEAEYTRETEQLNHRIHEIEAERDQLNHRIHEIEAERDQQNRRIHEIEAERDQLNHRIHEIEAERDQQNHRIHEIEAERDRLQQQTIEQESALQAGAEETSQLSQRVEELSGSLAQHIAKGLQTEEEFAREKDSLAGNLRELQEKYEASCGQLDTLKKESEELSRQHLTEIESQQSANEKLATHVKKLQDLSRALHDSHISESEMHNKLLAERDSEIEMLRASAVAGNAMAVEMASATEETEKLQTAMHGLESRLAAAESEREALGERAREVDKLEATVAQLSAALQETMESSQQHGTDTQEFQAQVAELRAALETAGNERDALAGKLEHQQALEQEVNSLREALQQADSRLHEQAEVAVDSSNDEVEALRAALETAGNERDALAGKLEHHQALEQEVNSLREAMKQADSRLHEQADVAVDSSNDEVEALRAALETAGNERDALAGKLEHHQALEQEVYSLREAMKQADSRLHEQAEACCKHRLVESRGRIAQGCTGRRRGKMRTVAARGSMKNPCPGTTSVPLHPHRLRIPFHLPA